MRIEIKNIFTGKYIFRLTYKLTVKKGIFFVDIQSEKFERKKFFSCGSLAPCGMERCVEQLPKMGYSAANSLFDEISENLVFPCSLSYIIEDMEVGSDEFAKVP